MSPRDRERRLRDWRSVRIGATVSLAACVFWLFMDAFVLHSLAGLAAQAVLAIAVGFLLLRALRAPRRFPPGPDYAAIASMETEVWGRTFSHQGAPGESASAERRAEALSCVVCGFGAAAFHGNLCGRCSLRVQCESREAERS